MRDIQPGPNGSFPSALADVNGTLFFKANAGPMNDFELWKSDGTPLGTLRVKDIHPGMLDSNPSDLTNVSGTLFFTANDGSTGQELWKSDGTTLGTERVKDIYPGMGGSIPTELTNANGTLFFRVTLPDAKLYVSNGTDSGTLVVDTTPSQVNSATGLTVSGLRLFFANGGDLWAVDISSPPALGFYTVTPCRVIDTRRPNGTYGGPALNAQEARAFPIADQCLIPVTAKAVSLNLTVTQSTATGNLRLLPGGQVPLAVSTINYSAGQTRNNNAIVSLNAAHEMSAYVGQATGTTVHLIIDVNGYFQ